MILTRKFKAHDDNIFGIDQDFAIDVEEEEGDKELVNAFLVSNRKLGEDYWRKSNGWYDDFDFVSSNTNYMHDDTVRSSSSSSSGSSSSSSSSSESESESKMKNTFSKISTVFRDSFSTKTAQIGGIAVIILAIAMIILLLQSNSSKKEKKKVEADGLRSSKDRGMRRERSKSSKSRKKSRSRSRSKTRPQSDKTKAEFSRSSSYNLSKSSSKLSPSRRTRSHMPSVDSSEFLPMDEESQIDYREGFGDKRSTSYRESFSKKEKESSRRRNSFGRSSSRNNLSKSISQYDEDDVDNYKHRKGERQYGGKADDYNIMEEKSKRKSKKSKKRSTR